MSHIFDVWQCESQQFILNSKVKVNQSSLTNATNWGKFDAIAPVDVMSTSSIYEDQINIFIASEWQARHMVLYNLWAIEAAELYPKTAGRLQRSPKPL